MPIRFEAKINQNQNPRGNIQILKYENVMAWQVIDKLDT
jgi:hypothetical protein